jgi:tetratricopeptide (TPR) repeat protein
MKRTIPLLFFALVFGAFLHAQAENPLQTGIRLYGEGRWREAVIELRRVQAAEADQRAEALYWIALAELSAGEYESALRDLDELTGADPASPRAGEIPYHRGRAFYYLGRYDEAMLLLKSYTDGVSADTLEGGGRKAAALYWIGECLFALGQLEKALDVFSIITEEYPYSVKYEAAAYRAALINQKKIEAELLSILQWSHEESLKTMEEYQRREHSYDQAITAYQKRIAEMLQGGRDPGNAIPDPITELLEREPITIESPPVPSDVMIRLLSGRAQAVELRDRIMESLGSSGKPGGAE